uniref:Letm1 RBD domain-containing protein n=1 Tax=Cyanistes caeruleus TaxID=156563 RepID=A0A8C0U359_CYACU
SLLSTAPWQERAARWGQALLPGARTRGNSLEGSFRYFFPRQLLIRYFWTPKQQLEFLDAYDCIRRDSYRDVLRSLALAARSLPEPQPRQLLQQLCAQVCPLLLPPLGAGEVLALSQVLFLTPHLPAFFLRHRLRSHVLEIRHLDRALLQLGLGQLSEEELRAACYLRGLNSTHLGQAECRAWLEQWLRLSCEECHSWGVLGCWGGFCPHLGSHR